MAKHILKTHPHPFQAVLDDWKTHELRKNDRNFKVGDILTLREFDPDLDDGEQYTGRQVDVLVTYISGGMTFDLPSDLCVMSIRRFATKLCAL